jgi:hypothetical protein
MTDSDTSKASAFEREGHKLNAPYRRYVGDLLARYATRNGSLEPPEAMAELVAVTGKSLSTVRNWLVYRQYLPDLESFAKIVLHWRIPATEVFPADLENILLSEPPHDTKPIASQGVAPPGAFDIRDAVMFSPFGNKDQSVVIKALSKYTDFPRSTMFVRMESADMEEKIRIGEIMLADCSDEQISRNGMYLLRYTGQSGAVHTCVRMVIVLAGQNLAKLVCLNPLFSSSDETVPLVDGQLPSHITILGRVAGLLHPT